MLEFSNREKENLGKDLYEELRCRDMRSFDEKPDTNVTDDENQTKEDLEEGWDSEKQSPLVERVSGPMDEIERIRGSELETGDEVRECLKDSLDCYQTCSETVVRCIDMGGKHAKSSHLNLLIDCSKICNSNVDFILRNSNYFPQTCGITADICDECADSCDRFDDDFMKDCAEVCRRCAESCRELAR